MGEAKTAHYNKDSLGSVLLVFWGLLMFWFLALLTLMLCSFKGLPS